MRQAWFFLISLLLYGCTNLMSAALQPPTISIQDINPVELGLLQQRFEIQLQLENPNNVDLPLEGLNFDLSVNDLPLASVSSNQPILIPRQGTQVVKLEAATTSSNLIKQLHALNLDALRSGARYKINGRVKIKGLIWLPLEKSGQVGIKNKQGKPSVKQTI
ncbi:MAG: LEA type 2 family protein [Thiobacillaceae bacterium]